MSTVLDETRKEFYTIGIEKGLTPIELSLAFDEYCEICGNNWDEHTAQEIISNWT